ncbi:MAG: hypothetical protein H7274_25930 [Rhodoferax sp.]|nr:hypothetical protein [Rhodoferax sp.]
MALALLAPSTVLAQQRAERGGIVLFWGLVPAEIVSEKHSLQAMHGVVPSDGGQIHHLVVALFRKADGSRITDAIMRAQLHESGIVDEAAKYLTPMTINEQASYGQLFSTAKSGPYRFRVIVRLPERSDELEFLIDAASPHRKTD